MEKKTIKKKIPKSVEPKKKVSIKKTIKNLKSKTKEKSEEKEVAIESVEESVPVPKTTRGKQSDIEREIERQEIAENGGYIHGVYATTEAAKRIAEQTRYAIDNSKAKLFVDRLDSPSVINYLEGLENKLVQAERIANFKSSAPKKRKNAKPKK